MRYLLSPFYALRSWWLIPYAYYDKRDSRAKSLKQHEFERLLLCDGMHELEADELTQNLLDRGLIVPCTGQAAGLTPWQEHRSCENRYFPHLIWEITGRCNYNCRHCFNAEDNAPLQSEWTPDEALSLLDQAQQCGVQSVTLTGGEPLLYPYLTEVLEGIHDRGLNLQVLNTNGALLSEKLLDRLNSLGFTPLMKISFDGLGHHDWMRQHEGAERKALDAIRLCIQRNFPVMVNYNVHRLNADTVDDSLALLDRMGVAQTKLIRTTESPRWTQNAGDACLTLPEYYDLMQRTAAAYGRQERHMDVIAWQLYTLYVRDHSYYYNTIKCSAGEYRDTLPLCQPCRENVFVSANGHVFPCQPMSGYYEATGQLMGDVKADGLSSILRGGTYLDTVCANLSKLRRHGGKCASCRYFKACAGGCRALAQLMTQDRLGPDPAKCLFFEQGYNRMLETALPGWTNLLPLESALAGGETSRR